MSLVGLLPASFRGVPFGVSGQSTIVSRRLAVHEYPGREEVWTEDMGRGATRYRLRGFILEDDIVYAGGPIELQRLAVLAAAKASGPSVLIHPTLGLLTVSCESASISEALDGATFSEIEWSFVEAGSQSFPSLSLDGQGVSGAVIAAVAVAAAAVRLIGLAGQSGAGSATGALPAVSAQWAGQVGAAGDDATALSRLSASLPGNLGRYSRGATTGYLSQITSTSSSTLDELVALAAMQRAAIATASAGVAAAIAALTVSTDEADYTDAVAVLLSTLTGACADPADALRLLEQLLGFQPKGIDAGSPAGAATTALWQRAMALEIVRAASTYQAQSYEDAFAQMVRVAGVLDAAIGAAGNTGQDALFSALRALRTAVVQDFRARGAALAHVRTFVVASSVPSLVLAQRFYRDPARADELVGEAGAACVSPLFMPLSIQALAA